MVDRFFCLVRDHDPWLVALALMVCGVGSAATAQLVGRTRESLGTRRVGWLTLSAVGMGTIVWCTHFVAMMAFRMSGPVILDPLLTFASLLIAIVAAVPGLALVSYGTERWSAALGGVLVGAAISAMHYTGMAAYRIPGVVTWEWRYVTASLLLSSSFAAAAFWVMSGFARHARVWGGALLALGVIVLHFTGMAAMTVDMRAMSGGTLSPLTTIIMAMSTACAGTLVIACATVSVMIDSQARADAFSRLRRMALHDGLTDLPNRVSFHDELARRLQRVDLAGRLAIVIIDLSRFRHINDTYGHQAGDHVLVVLARRLVCVSRGAEYVARIGADEFGAIIPCEVNAALRDFLDRVVGIFTAPVAFNQASIMTRSNIGIALSSDEGADAHALLAKADLAIRRAKLHHSAAPCFYKAEMDDAIRDRHDLISSLRSAIAMGGFELHYQVQASIETGLVKGYEALARWHHPTRGAIPPNLFIALAEEIGEIIPLSNWILRKACSDAAGWNDAYVVSVNLSPLQLSDPALVATVRRALADSGLPARRLALELTESAIIRDRTFALEQLHALKGMGIGLALDDFGIGYSSLDVLRAFPFDQIKLDRSFVAEIDKSPQAVLILRSVAALGASLQMPVLAEGIEDVAQLQIARQEGCAAVQGYLIGRPGKTLVDPESVRRMIT